MWPNSPANPFTPRWRTPLATQSSTDSRSQGDQQHVVGAHGGAQLPLGHRGCGGVVVDADRLTQSLREQAPDGEVGDAVEVRCGPQDSLPGDQSGHTDAETAVDTERGGEFDERVDERYEAAVAPRRVTTVLGHDVARLVEGDTQGLGPADVDADAHAHLRTRVRLRRGP